MISSQCLKTELYVSKQVTVDFRDPDILQLSYSATQSTVTLIKQKVHTNCNSRDKVRSPISKGIFLECAGIIKIRLPECP